MKPLRFLLIVFALSISTIVSSLACTTAVISGKFTSTGRPMIWKVRDTEEYKNVMKNYKGEKWNYVGMINTSDPTGQQVWGGWNGVGFAIMNSASFNVNEGYKGTYIDREGYLMHEALRRCRTLEDFEKMLDERQRPMGVAAHFGVIDAEGGAAFYEVNNETWTKFDANNSAQAPRGYVLRTNFSMTGKEGEGIGFIRYQTVTDVFAEIPVGRLDIRTVMQNLSRCTRHSVTKVDYREVYSNRAATGAMVSTDDLICRYGTSSTIAIEGINPSRGEKPNQTTGWVQIGLPYASMTLPVWCDTELPAMLSAAKEGDEAPMSTKAMALKEELYPLWKQSDGYHYIAIDKMFNSDGSGLTQRIEKEEVTIFDVTAKAREIWGSRGNRDRDKANSPAELTKRFNRLAEDFYNKL